MVGTPVFSLSVNGQAIGYTSTGLVLDHTSRRIRGMAVAIEENDSFLQSLRDLRRGQTIQLSLLAHGVSQYNGDAEVVMIRERLNRRAPPGISFIFRMLSAS
jgi:hypothetical protein